MEKRTIKIHSFIIGVSILETFVLYSAYYFMNQLWISVLLSILLNFILCHIILESSLSFDSEFLYVLVTMLLTIGCTLLIYFNADRQLLVYHKYLPVLIFLQWLVPVFYNTFRSIFDRGPRFVGYRSFFIKASLVFFLCYGAVAAWELFLHPIQFPEPVSSVAYAYVPFMSTAAYIQDYIYNGLDLMPLLFYIAKILLLLLPLGFYIQILLHDMPFVVKMLSVLLVPAIYLNITCFYGYSFYLDTSLFGIVGYLLGCLCLQILNRIARSREKSSFLSERSSFSTFNMYY